MANLRTNNLCGEGFVSANDGTVWSDYVTSTTGSTLTNYPATYGFDGNLSNFVYADNNSTMTWTPPNGGIKAGLIEVYVYAGNTHPIVRVNGVSTGAVVGSDYGQQGNWVDVTSLVGGHLKTIEAYGYAISGTARSSGWSAVRINGEILIDGKYGTTGGRRAIKGSVFFDGTGDKLSVPNSADVRLGSNDFTVEAWVKFGDVSGYWDAIIGMWDSSNSRRTFNLQRYKSGGADNDGYLYLYVSDDGSSTDQNVGGGNLTINEWHHVAGVRDGNTLRIYQNGVQVGTTSFSGTILNNTTDALFIGDVESDDSNNMNGFISNVRLVNGTCLYPDGTTFTPPQHELTLVPNTVLLACQDSDDVTQEATGKTITAAGNLTDAAYVRMQPKVIPPYGIDAGNTFRGPIQQSSQGYMYFPTGKTEERGRGRGFYMLGYFGTPSASSGSRIDYINIQSMGNSIRFGDLTVNRYTLGAGASSTRGLFTGGYQDGLSPDTDVNTIEFITIATEGKAQDFGDRVQVGRTPACASNDTRCVMASAFTPAGYQNTIDFVTTATLGNATNFGDLSTARAGMSMSCNSTTRGIFNGGYQPSPSTIRVNNMEYITFSTAGNTTDFGDLTDDSQATTGGTASSSTRGLIGLGYVHPTRSNAVDFCTIATTGNAQDFGDLTAAKQSYGSCSNSIRGIFLGGQTPSYINNIDMVSIATTGDATDFGDVDVGVTASGAAGSDSHGGLS